jgi:hypothetical protein
MSGETVASVVVGGVIGLLANLVVGWFFYRRADKSFNRAMARLGDETARLERLSTMLLNVLEDNGLAELNRGPDGQPTGRVVRKTLTATVGTTASFDATVIEGRRTPPDGGGD